MNPTLTEVLDALERCGSLVDAALREMARSEQPQRLTEVMKQLWPASLYAVLLVEGGVETIHLRDQNGKPRPEWEGPTRATLSAWAKRKEPGTITTPVPPETTLSHHVLAGVPILWGGRGAGVLAFAYPNNEPAATVAVARALGEKAADRIALGLCTVAVSPSAAEEEVERQRFLNNLPELTSLVAHEFNNFLNSLMLHVALLKQMVPKELANELDVMRSLGNHAASFVKKLQQYNSRQRPPLQPVDLNQLVREAAAVRPTEGPIVLSLELAEALPAVSGHPRDLRRLVNLLLDQSFAATGAGPGTIAVRTERRERKIVLRLSDSGPRVEEKDLPHLFDAFGPLRAGSEEPTLAIAHSLARRFQGTLRVENTEKGMDFTLELNSASS